MSKEIKKDFGQVIIPKMKNRYEMIHDFMESHGFNVKYCDICNIVEEDSILLFKFVHWSVPTAMTEPYYKIEFVIQL